MVNELSQSSRPENLSICSVFHVPEILDRILAYSISFNNIICLCLVCKTWKFRVENLLPLRSCPIKSPFYLLITCCSTGSNMTIPLIASYIRNSPDRSPSSLVTGFDLNDEQVRSYIKENYVYSFGSLTGWTILGYIKTGFTSVCGSLTNITYPRYVKTPAHQDKITFAMSVCKTEPTFDRLVCKPGIVNSRTVLIIKDREWQTYRLLECHSHNIEKDLCYVPLGELVQSVKYNHEPMTNKTICYSDNVQLLFYNVTKSDKLEIQTKSKIFELGAHDYEGTYLTHNIRNVK